MTKINTNFSNLNTDKVETSVLDTDTTLAANSDAKVATQKAVKTYIDTSGGANASETARGIVEEATDAEVTAGTATGGTGAKLIVTPAKLATRLTALGVADWVQLGETTLSVDATSVEVASFSARKDLMIVFACRGLSAGGSPLVTFNSDGGGNYGQRYSVDFAASAAVNAQAQVNLNEGIAAGVLPCYCILNIQNDATGFRKFGTLEYFIVSATGTTAPETHKRAVFVWNNTTAQITTVKVAASANNLLAGTRLTVYGKKD